MGRRLWIYGSMLACLLLGSCGGAAPASETCTITAVMSPASATADHSLLPPANQVQFTTTSTVTGNCPLIADKLGSWSTSDPTNTTISNDAPNQGQATCLKATPTPATITNSGTVRGRTFTPATLTCK